MIKTVFDSRKQGIWFGILSKLAAVLRKRRAIDKPNEKHEVPHKFLLPLLNTLLCCEVSGDKANIFFLSLPELFNGKILQYFWNQKFIKLFL